MFVHSILCSILLSYKILSIALNHEEVLELSNIIILQGLRKTLVSIHISDSSANDHFKLVVSKDLRGDGVRVDKSNERCIFLDCECFNHWVSVQPKNMLSFCGSVSCEIPMNSCWNVDECSLRRRDRVVSEELTRGLQIVPQSQFYVAGEMMFQGN